MSSRMPGSSIELGTVESESWASGGPTPGGGLPDSIASMSPSCKMRIVMCRPPEHSDGSALCHLLHLCNEIEHGPSHGRIRESGKGVNHDECTEIDAGRRPSAPDE